MMKTMVPNQSTLIKGFSLSSMASMSFAVSLPDCGEEITSFSDPLEALTEAIFTR